MVNGGGGGIELVMVTFRPADRADRLPASSRVRAVKRNVPFGRADDVIVQTPPAVDKPLPNRVVGEQLDDGSRPVPVKVGVLSVVFCRCCSSRIGGGS
jgi:hypothetical protein